MSKQSKKKALKRRQHNRRATVMTVCDRCTEKVSLSPAFLMERLANTLTLLEGIGKVRVREGHIIAESERGGGYVIPPLKGAVWETHMMTYNPVPQLSRREDEIDS